jgi:ParB family chromosome partitioning protein
MIAATVERVAISKIEVGSRRRKTMSSLRSLTRSIEDRGLLHPILIRNGRELVAGQRRLEACKLLGWSTIPTRDVTGCSDEELRAIELEENTQRQDLNAYELSRQRLAEIQAIRKRGPTSVPFSKGRGKKVAGSRKDVARETGISPDKQRRLEQHVALADTYPMFQRPGWGKDRVLEGGKLLEQLPKAERAPVAAIFDTEILPKTAVRGLRHLLEFNPAERAEILTRARDADPEERAHALTDALKLPPPPDGGLLILDHMRFDAKRAIQASRIPGAREIIAPVITTIEGAVRALEAAKNGGAG